MSRPTLEELRERAEEQRDRELDDEMAIRWAKDQLLTYAAEHLTQLEATLPGDASEQTEAWVIQLKRAMRELWHSYRWPPDLRQRAYSDYEPPEDFDYGELSERWHEEAREKYLGSEND